MSITLYTGDPGAGKSYGVVEHVILPSIAEGRHIVTNIPLNRGLLLDYAINQGWPEPKIINIDFEQVALDPSKLLNHESGTVFVLDEVWELFPSGQKAAQADKYYLEFFRKHRHRVGDTGHTDQIVLLTQNPADLASWVRNTISETYWMCKLDKVGMPDRFRVDVLSYCPGVRGKRSEKIRELFGKYEKQVYQFYTSQTQNKSKNWGHGSESKVDKRANALNARIITIGIPSAVVLILGGVYMLYSTVTGYADANESVKYQAPVQVRTKEPVPDVIAQRMNQDLQTTYSVIPAPNVERSQQSPVTEGLAVPSTEALFIDSHGTGFSTKWRIAAHLRMGDREMVHVQGRNGLREIDPGLCYYPDNITDLHCALDGEIVTMWTGYLMQSYARAPVEIQNQ